MSAPNGTIPGQSTWQSTQPQGPPMAQSAGESADGVTIKPMRLKILYTFDDQNKTNCLARWPHVLNIQTVLMDETTTIGVVELKTCIDAIVQCSPELVARLGHDYTVYAYDYSEYDNPLVGQGMLSWALATASPTPGAPAHQSRQLITGRVCKNIMGLFSNGVKETLEVKLRLVPVPTVLQNEYLNTMEKYRELSKVMPPGFDANEWTSFLQSNPNIGQSPAAMSPAPQIQQSGNQRDGASMEVMNRLLSPSMQQPTATDPSLQGRQPENATQEDSTSTNITGKSKADSRPSSRASVKRSRARKSKAVQNTGGNNSGYEEGTDGDDGPAPSRKRAKVTKADWNSNMSIGTAPDSLRVAASTAGSLRLFRPIAMSPNPTSGPNHLQEIPRAPTPVPRQQNSRPTLNAGSQTSNLRRESFTSPQYPPLSHVSPYPPLSQSEDQVMTSIESAQPSPERNFSPMPTPPEIGSSPPLMRTRPGTPMRSSPPCAFSPVLPQMPRTDSGFMSGSLDDLFGDDEDALLPENEAVDAFPTVDSVQLPKTKATKPVQAFSIEQVMPGPVELLPTRMPIIDPARAAESYSRAMSRANSVMSEDGLALPPLKKSSRKNSQLNSTNRSNKATTPQQVPHQDAPQETPVMAPRAVDRRSSEPCQLAPKPPEAAPTQDQPSLPTPAPTSRPSSRTLIRTASLGSLTFPQVPASDPALPPSSLHRSQTWSEAPHPATEAPIYPALYPQQYLTEEAQYQRPAVPFSRTMAAKREHIRSKLETAIANGEMPPYCSNCGAIETPTWRKAWSQDLLGKPPYYEYSDEPGRVTAVNILTRDALGEITSYQLIKKFLLPEEKAEDFKEYILCNPCGIWMSKYKTQRPEDRWANGGPQERTKGGERKRPQQRPRPRTKKNANAAIPTSDAMFPPSEAYFPPSDAYFPQSDAYFPHSDANYPQFDGMGPPDGISPGDTTETPQQQEPSQQQELLQHQELPQQQDSVQDQQSVQQQENLQQQEVSEQPSQDILNDQQRRSGSGRPRKRLNAMTSDAASAALRRAIQSSPARWVAKHQSPIAGTQHSPINLEEEELGPTRRVLFPSPAGKNGSPRVLGDVATNVVTIPTEFRSPKESMMEMPDKENRPPAFNEDDMDAELLALFEEELGKGDDVRPVTPPSKSPIANPFKTPTRPTPSRRPITRSVSRSARSNKTPRQLMTFNRTPTGCRRSPRHHGSPTFDSPFTATLNQMMSEANNQTQPIHQAVQLDFDNMQDLSDLPTLDRSQHYDMNFNIEDLFSTDMPMPSSPPRSNLYEDPLTRDAGNDLNWDDFGDFQPPQVEVKVKEELKESPKKHQQSEESSKETGS